ncbi:Putative AraC-family regulatory protein [Mycobacteroides abscessus subsp. abscessus]|nr:AraC family transcriptional regulator [Mycobacteroides abscessus M94]SHQ51839.1 Putative AraC-family regulatory protein [Mycobacteroides abscessus subsp. abscessus]SHW89704.1 Putative AraC-family regulatory protein [Mycobacteroides abscessus subsp. abscessus]SIB42882.1 Putative AraC-family regulatory protein [Mycobacteroides abscessus subsp. abscessus]SIG65536.1 Putative AraC-family regulatory protein [Mycobacteroides abscessus subsp. abscessus]
MRSPARYEGRTTADASWRAVSAAADVTLSGIAHGYTELRERAHRPVERSEVAGVAPVLVVELDAPLLVADVADHASPRIWQAFVAGVSQGPSSTVHSGAQHCIEVRLTPLGLHRVSGLAMDAVSNRVVSLEELFGKKARYLPERLAAEPNWVRRFDLLDSVFMRAAAEGPEADAEVEFAWHRLNRTGGTAGIGEILTERDWLEPCSIGAAFPQPSRSDAQSGRTCTSLQSCDDVAQPAGPPLALLGCLGLRIL